MRDWKELNRGEKAAFCIITFVVGTISTILLNYYIILLDRIDFDDSSIRAKFDSSLFDGVKIIYTDKPMTDPKRFIFYGERNTNLGYYMIYFRTIKVYIGGNLEESLCHELQHHKWYTRLNESDIQFWEEVYNLQDWQALDDRLDSSSELFAYGAQESCGK